MSPREKQMAYVCIQAWLEHIVTNTHVYSARDQSPWKEIFEHFARARHSGFAEFPDPSGSSAAFAADSLATDPARLDKAVASAILALATHAACSWSNGYVRIAVQDLQALIDATTLWEKHRLKESPASLIEEEPAAKAPPAKIPQINLIRRR